MLDSINLCPTQEREEPGRGRKKLPVQKKEPRASQDLEKGKSWTSESAF